MTLEKKDWVEIKKQSEEMIKRLKRDSEISILASELMLEEANRQIKIIENREEEEKCQTDTTKKE